MGSAHSFGIKSCEDSKEWGGRALTIRVLGRMLCCDTQLSARSDARERDLASDDRQLAGALDIFLPRSPNMATLRGPLHVCADAG